MKSIQSAVETTVKELGKIDFVVAGAAGNFLATVSQLSTNAFKSVIDIDLIGSYNTVKATLEEIKKTAGQYIFVSANLHYTGSPFQAHVSAAKAGVDALSNNLAIELGPLGIRSNIVCPGPIDGTEGMERLTMKGHEEFTRKSVPLGNYGSTQDIADATVYLFSDAAKFVTGTTLVVDGGSWRTSSSPPGVYPDVVTELNSQKSKL